MLLVITIQLMLLLIIIGKGNGITRNNQSNIYCNPYLQNIQPKHNEKSSTRYPCKKESQIKYVITN